MAKSTPVQVSTCVVCGLPAVCAFSLRVTRDKGEWHSNPVYPDCRRKLIREARKEDQFIPFFRIDNSQREVKKRNGEIATHRPFLEKFGQKRKVRPRHKAS